MKTLNITILCALLALCLATTQAGAALYDITFDDGNGNLGSGQVDVLTAGNNFYAASGSLNLTLGGVLSTWDLYTGGGTTTYPGFLLSPGGGYIYNNAVYPTGQNPQYPTVSSLLDIYGLLFRQSSGNNELNLWGNADGTYNLGGSIGGFQNLNVNIGFGGTAGNPIITQAPEPTTLALATFGGVLAALSTFRKRR